MTAAKAQASAPSALRYALVLALGAAVSLGLARFSYALLLPVMRAELGWSYFTAGSMNTLNAAGYLVGALLMPRLLRRASARQLLVAASLGVSLCLALHGSTRSDAILYALRFATGAFSALIFVSGGLLAARLSQQSSGSGHSAGLILGIYYGGTGLGIVASALLLPAVMEQTALGAGLSGWQWGWLVLSGLSLVATAAMHWQVPSDPLHSGPASAAGQLSWWRFAPGLAAYGLFGLGYIGYMTFIISLLREQHMGTTTIVAFYTLLGLGVMASPWLWAGLLQRERGGRALMLLCALLALATAMPVLVQHPVGVFVSGALFGSVFLSVVASTTALVRHNLAASSWSAGISAFTIVFALGQILGPGMVGWLSDRAGNLSLGLAVSAGVLGLAALLAWGQRPLELRSTEALR